MTGAATSYDEVPYSSKPFADTTPSRLAAVARLLGLETSPVERCRVLELGCGTGTNLIPMAEQLPGSRFLGIDLSSRQIGMGRAMAEALNLTNLELQALSILDVGPDLGQFDYILCHGVYSWVPAEVRERILAICSTNLAPNGLAYISYNTYPGWHIRGMIREMMGFHVGQFAEPQERVRQARAFLHFLIEAVGSSEGNYGQLLQLEAELLDEASDTYVYHEHLEEVNRPVYFHEFAAQAAARGLQYLAEARPIPLGTNLKPEVVRTLETISTDVIRAEQYLDFIRNRTFRKSLLCHAAVPLSRPPAAERLRRLFLTSVVRPVEDAEAPGSPGVQTFESIEGRRMRTNNPVVIAGLRTLYAAWPRALAFDTLWARVSDQLAGSPALSSPLTLAEPLLQCYLSGLLELQTFPAPIAAEAGDRPRAVSCARYQAREENRVTSLRHTTVVLDDLDRLVLGYLDGTHDRSALLDFLVRAVESNTLQMARDGQTSSPENLRAVLADALEGSLYRLRRSALLVEPGAALASGSL